jgi:hypothetical protein
MEEKWGMVFPRREMSLEGDWLSIGGGVKSAYGVIAVVFDSGMGFVGWAWLWHPLLVDDLPGRTLLVFLLKFLYKLISVTGWFSVLSLLIVLDDRAIDPAGFFVHSSIAVPS